MISLVQLLKEMQDSPKAIFLAGPAGSGKSYISSQLIPNTFTVINSDDTYEELLKASGIGLKQKDFTPDQLSQASKLQAQARKVTQDKLAQSIESKKTKELYDIFDSDYQGPFRKSISELWGRD